MITNQFDTISGAGYNRGDTLKGMAKNKASVYHRGLW
jgi:hypothetical protein